MRADAGPVEACGPGVAVDPLALDLAPEVEDGEVVGEEVERAAEVLPSATVIDGGLLARTHKRGKAVDALELAGCGVGLVGWRRGMGWLGGVEVFVVVFRAGAGVKFTGRQQPGQPG